MFAKAIQNDQLQGIHPRCWQLQLFCACLLCAEFEGVVGLVDDEPSLVRDGHKVPADDLPQAVVGIAAHLHAFSEGAGGFQLEG